MGEFISPRRTCTGASEPPVFLLSPSPCSSQAAGRRGERLGATASVRWAHWAQLPPGASSPSSDLPQPGRSPFSKHTPSAPLTPLQPPQQGAVPTCPSPSPPLPAPCTPGGLASTPPGRCSGPSPMAVLTCHTPPRDHSPGMGGGLSPAPGHPPPAPDSSVHRCCQC